MIQNAISDNEKKIFFEERSLIRPDTIEQTRERLQSAYLGKFDYQQFTEAQSYISMSLNEAEKDLSIKQRSEQAKQNSRQSYFHVIICQLSDRFKYFIRRHIFRILVNSSFEVLKCKRPLPDFIF